MFKKKYLGLAIAATLAAGSAQAALETSVVLKNETARFVKDGIRTGEATTNIDTTGEGKTTFKFENTAKIFLNDELDNGMSWHGELNIVRDTKAIDDYKGHESYSQQDWLRELYVDTKAGDWDLRVGKQQVVWGAVDGIKLLDMINPTDWREFNQNTPADARIPVWMINAERYLDNGANVQVIVSQAEESKIAGLNASGDQGHPFIMKGVDTITGKVNGFLNIAPALAKVADTFDDAALAGFFGSFDVSAACGGVSCSTATSLGGAGTGLTYFSSFTVDFFSKTAWMLPTGFGGSSTTGLLYSGGSTSSSDNSGTAYSAATDYISSTSESSSIDNPYGESGYVLLNYFAQNDLSSMFTNNDNGNDNITNLMYQPTSSTVGWNAAAAQSAFELMPNATFATFNTFAANGSHAAMTSRYVKDYPADAASNLAFRFRNSTDTGLNYSASYAYRYDSNPSVDISYHDASTGAELTTEIRNSSSGVISRTSSALNNPGVSGTNTVYLKNGTTYYGSVDPGLGTLSTNGVEMRFTESLNRIHTLGGAFDFAVDSGDQPVVLRAEFVYERDTLTPVVDKRLISIGDLEGGLTPAKADMFKYALAAETTVMTDLLASAQFIQFRNLDYVDESRTCSTYLQQSFSCNKYTADASAMHLSNGFQKAEKNKNFYSLFLSKPFGESGEGRWNNIFMFEEGGGKWNRFDVEYGINDQLIGTLEYNKYFGDENTMFGQFENASNVQIGLKYLLQ